MPYLLLDYLPLWLLFGATLLFSWLAFEGGYYLGKWIARRAPNEERAPVGVVEGAILALLGIMLAFTFSIAVTFYGARRDTLLDEANAIGTTFLRARLLPEPQRTAIRELLRRYVSVRLEAVQQGEVNEALTTSEALHQQLWSQAIALNEKQPNSIIIGIFIQSLNQVIDLHAKRVMVGLRSRIPWFVWAVLYFVTVLAMAGVGYHSGVNGRRSLPVSLGLVLSFSAVLMLIADLDRPHAGLLRVGQETMVDLQKSMAE